MPRRTKPAKAKVRAKPSRTAPPREGGRVRDLEKRLAESLARENAKDRALTESLEQQTAASEILRLIGGSPSKLQPVFDSIAKHATALTDAVYGAVYLLEDESIHLRAYYSEDIPNARQFAAAFPMPITSETLIAGTLRTGTLAHIADMEDVSVPEVGRRLARTLGVRSTLTVPMRRDGRTVGAIGVNRHKPGDFTPAEIALLQTFADQAVIAIENARLFSETNEALEQQTATSEILRVIASSPTNVQRVFDTIAEHAWRLCDAAVSGVLRFDGELVHVIALGNIGFDSPIVRQFPMPPSNRSAPARAVLTGQMVHIPDVLEDPEYPVGPQAAASGFRSALAVPMLREGQVIGCIVVGRSRPGPYSTAHMELLKTFADQAVIAIENVRLFNELQEKNQTLTGAYTQIRALGEVGQAISSTLDV